MASCSFPFQAASKENIAIQKKRKFFQQSKQTLYIFPETFFSVYHFRARIYSVGTCNYLHFFFKLMNNVLVAYLYKPGNAPSLCALMLHLRAVTKVRCHLRFFFNLGHQTKQYLNLVERFRGKTNFFGELTNLK